MTSVAWSQEILIPTSSAAKDKAIFAHSSKNIVGNGFFPVSYSEANLKLPEKDTTRNWIMRKLFSEHFIQQSGKDFFLAIDPLVNMSIGDELLQIPPNKLF